MLIYILISLILGTLSGLLGIPLILSFCKKKHLYDMPSERKVHKNAIPRLGGISFLPSVFLAFMGAVLFASINGVEFMQINLWSVCFMVSLGAIYVMGAIDDILGLGATTKLIIQLVSVSLLPLSGLWLNDLHGFLGIESLPMWIGMPLTVLAVSFICNAINLIDGIDGLSGCLSLVMLGGFMWAFNDWGLRIYVIIIAGLMGVILAFLRFNLFGNAEKGTKIFMGDTGSLSLGYFMAFMSLKLSMINVSLPTNYDGNGLLVGLTLLIVPVFDVFRVAFLRIRHHRSPMAPDKNHIHHKFMRAGMNQHQALFAIVLTAIGFIAINAILSSFITDSAWTWIVLIDIVAYSVLHLMLDRFITHKGNEAIVF